MTAKLPLRVSLRRERAGGSISHALGLPGAAFEVKSLPGPFREWQRGIERDEGRGLDATGRMLMRSVRWANGVLLKACISFRGR